MFAFGILNFFIFIFLNQSNELRATYIRAINDAGKQRFYSQLILQKAHYLIMDGDILAKESILMASQEMEKNGIALEEKFYSSVETLRDVHPQTELFLNAVGMFVQEPSLQHLIDLRKANDIFLPHVLNAVETLEECFAKKQNNTNMYIFFMILLIVVSALFLVKFIFMPTITMLQAAHEAQILINALNIVEDFNVAAEKIFYDVKKGAHLKDLFEGDDASCEKFLALLELPEDRKHCTFVYRHKHYKVEVKEISRFLRVLDIYDVSELVKEGIRKDVIYNSQKAIVVVTDGKKIKNINAAFYEEFGYEDMEHFKSLHNCICDLFLHREGSEYLHATMDGMAWNKYMQKNPRSHYEVLMQNKNGQEKIYEVKTSGNLFAEAEEEEEEEEEIIVFNDITELQEKNKLLIMQSKDAAIGEMISMIAHQWRQPLSVLSTILSRIKIQKSMDMLDNASFYAAIDKASSQINYMSTTIEDFRDFFKNSDMREKVSVQEIIETPKHLMEGLLVSKGISFEVEYRVDPQLCIVTVASKLSQVFLNLYKNAMEQIVANEIEEGVIQTVVFEQNDTLVIEVCDNALGIDTKVLGRLFEPYFSTKSKNGTGLGLYMSKTIIQKHLRGDIQVHNKNGGALFCIFLPLETNQDDQ